MTSTRLRITSLLPLLLAAALGTAGNAAALTARDDPTERFGWLAHLAGHCWHGNSPHHAGTARVCYEFDRDRRVLRVHGRDAAGVTMDSVIRPVAGGLLLQTVAADPARAPSCWLAPLGWSFTGERVHPQALTCRIADPASTRYPRATWWYRFEPVAQGRYRVVETYEYGGHAHAFRQSVWLYVRAAADAAGTRDAADDACGCDAAHSDQ